MPKPPTQPTSIRGPPRAGLYLSTPHMSTRSHWHHFTEGQREAGACQGHISREASTGLELSSVLPWRSLRGYSRLRGHQH